MTDRDRDRANADDREPVRDLRGFTGLHKRTNDFYVDGGAAASDSGNRIVESRPSRSTRDAGTRLVC